MWRPFHVVGVAHGGRWVEVSLECPPQHELARLLCDLSKIDERVVGDFVSGFFRELSPSHRQNAPLNTAGATDGELSRPLTSSSAAAYSRERDWGVSLGGAGSCVALACQGGSRAAGPIDSSRSSEPGWPARTAAGLRGEHPNAV